jgi:hypothetical protein
MNMRHWLLRYRRVFSALLAVALLSTYPLANAVVIKTAPAVVADDAMPCHHSTSTTSAVTPCHQACCQDSQYCRQYCLAALHVPMGLPAQAPLMVTPVRRAQIVSLPDKILLSLAPLPEYHPPR